MKDGFVRATDPTRPPSGLERGVYAIGNFDGLHLGHQAVIRRTIALAEEQGAPSALLTFEPHPADHFAERPVAFRLTPPEMKASGAAHGERAPVSWAKITVADFCGTGVSDCAVGNTARDTSGSNPSLSATSKQNCELLA